MPNPIQKLLIPKKLWRFLGLVSTPIGLLCFALSASSKQLFGEWNFMKIFVYTVVSSIICTMMIFAHKFQPSSSLLLKPQVGFVAFMITSCFSFFYGKKVNGKPDICSLISGASFTLMSLSLSMQIDLGFEVDMFNFFLGFFLLQLMIINFLLAFVGGVFCYLLMYLRFCLDSQVQNEAVISPMNQVALEIDEQSRLQVEARSEINKESLYINLGIEKKSEEKIVFPTDMEAKIKEQCCTGSLEECRNVYLTWRTQILDEKMMRIELHKLDIKDIKDVPLDYIGKKIQRWIEVSDHILRVLLPNERNISNSVFLGYSPSYANLCFNELCKESMTKLLNFANAVASGKGSPVRLFRFLKMFEALRDLLPEIKSLFDDQYSEAFTIWEKLRGEIKNVFFMDLENLILQKREHSIIGAVPGGGVHPITHYIMNYLCDACQYLMTLEQVFENNHHGMPNSSPLFSHQAVRIVKLLEQNLKENSEMYYEDSALSSVFMMNNKRYIIQSAQQSKLRELLGEDWIQNQVSDFQHCFAEYYKRSWNKKVIGMLPFDGDDDKSSKEIKLSMFLSEFERTCEVQSTWVIFDKHVRKKVKSFLGKNLLKEYENFIARFQNVVETQDHNTNMFHEFEVQKIVDGIHKLFQVIDELKNHSRKMQPTWIRIIDFPNIRDLDFRNQWWKSTSHETFLDSLYPIEKYSCSHKLDQGCQATLEVQQRQGNQTTYEVRYTGIHTCELHGIVP